MAKKNIKYTGFIQLEGELHIRFSGRFDDEKEIPSWLTILHRGQLPSEEVFSIYPEDKPNRLFIVTSKISGFQFERTETEVS